MDSSENKEAGYGSVEPAMGAARNGRCHGSALAVLGLITMLLVCMAAFIDTGSSRIMLWSDPLVRERMTTDRDIIHRETTRWWKSDLHKTWSDPMVVEEERKRSQTYDVVQGPAMSYPDHKTVPKYSEGHHPAEVSHRPRQ